MNSKAEKMGQQEKVILVDENDQVLGTMEKLEAHQKGVLHRAISVFIFNDERQMLLQRRAMEKYHSPGLWSNTCCSHPRPEEFTIDAAKRRLVEEMGMDADLKFAFSFTYKTEFDNNLTEHELDHVFVGFSNELPRLNPSEVMDYQYRSISELKDAMEDQPDKFTSWFKICFDSVVKHANEDLIYDKKNKATT